MPRNFAGLLRSLDGKPYGAYRDAVGAHDVGGGLAVSLDRAQRDPFAPPSPVRMNIPAEVAELPADALNDQRGRIAAADYLTRALADALAAEGFDRANGTGGSGRIEIDRPGQEILERSSVKLDAAGNVEIRLYAGLPASGRRIRGQAAAELLAEDLPDLVESVLREESRDPAPLRAHVELYRDQEWLRDQLPASGLVAFVGDGAILPRRSGNSDLPLEDSPIAFKSTESLRRSFTLPSGKTVTGMGIPTGVTLIVGGGYHGKSTLLRALERSVYAHVAGDGREWVITREESAAIRAEDGRAVTGVDISLFINNLPSKANTRNFSTPNASGSTSQAANLLEAVEAGAQTLLIDEDTSATNFMIRDERMRALIPDNREPITPFVDRVRSLFTRDGVSTVLVAGGSGAFFEKADLVIAMDAYRPLDVTDQARTIAGVEAPSESGSAPAKASEHARSLDARCFQPRGGHNTKPPRGRGLSAIQIGKDTIDLSALSQIVDSSQTEAIARAITLISQRREPASVRSLIEEVTALIDSEGIDRLAAGKKHPGNLARPRALDIAAALNRYRGLRLA